MSLMLWHSCLLVVGCHRLQGSPSTATPLTSDPFWSGMYKDFASALAVASVGGASGAATAALTRLLCRKKDPALLDLDPAHECMC